MFETIRDINMNNEDLKITRTQDPPIKNKKNGKKCKCSTPLIYSALSSVCLRCKKSC
jgi:hypothetical protein